MFLLRCFSESLKMIGLPVVNPLRAWDSGVPLSTMRLQGVLAVSAWSGCLGSAGLTEYTGTAPFLFAGKACVERLLLPLKRRVEFAGRRLQGPSVRQGKAFPSSPCSEFDCAVPGLGFFPSTLLRLCSAFSLSRQIAELGFPRRTVASRLVEHLVT